MLIKSSKAPQLLWEGPLEIDTAQLQRRQGEPGWQIKLRGAQVATEDLPVAGIGKPMVYRLDELYKPEVTPAEIRVRQGRADCYLAHDAELEQFSPNAFSPPGPMESPALLVPAQPSPARTGGPCLCRLASNSNDSVSALRSYSNYREALISQPSSQRVSAEVPTNNKVGGALDR